MKTKLFLYCSIFSLFISGCEDIFVKDITGEQVAVISPADKSLLEGGKVLFSWDKMEGAERYHIEVFFGKQTLLYDTMTDTTRVELNLSAGEYQWSIYGYNSGYKSEKTTRSFRIKKDEDEE